jgi:hypothetical protein
MIPILYEWSGDFMVPLLRFHRRCNEQYVVGQIYRLVEEEERSHASHAHFFSVLAEGWRNLPEDIADRFPTAESLRKWCLIKCGFADVRSMVYETANDAKRAATLLGLYNEHAVIIAKGCVVSVYVAKSQSTRDMDKATFQASKTAVLDLVASMIGVTSAELAKQVPQPRRKAAHAAEPADGTTPAPSPETAPREPAPQAAGPSIPVPDGIPHAGAESPAAPPTSGTGATAGARA